MGITDVSQLTPELQSAAAPAGQPVTPAWNDPTGSGQGALASPGQPAPNQLAVPLAPAPGSLGDKLQGALATPANGTPLSFNDRLHAASNAAAEATPPSQRGKPGSWAMQLVAGAQHALSNIGEIQAASRANPRESIFETANRVKQTREKAATDEEKSQLEIASANTQRMYHQALLHQLNDDINHKDVANGKEKISALTDHLTSLGLPPSEITAKHINDAQLTKALNDKSWNPAEDVWYPDGTFEVPGKKDDQGNPLLQKTYTILKVPAQITLTPKLAAHVNEFVPGMKLDPENLLPMPGATAVSLMEQADRGEIAQHLHQQEMLDANVKKLTAEETISQKEAEARLNKNNSYIQARSQAKGNLQGVYDYLVKSDPQSASDLIQSYGGQKNFDTIVEKEAKDAEQARHDRAKEVEDAQKEKDKKIKESEFVGDETKTGEEFLRSLKPQEADALREVGTGHVTADRMGYLLAKSPNFIGAMHRAYPNFDSSQSAAYQAAYKDFTSGETSKILPHGSAALKHLRELHDLNTYKSRIPTSDDHQRYQNMLDTVVNELGEFYGNSTIPGLEGFKSTLGNFFNRDSAIQEQAKAMQSRLETIKQKWANAVPSEVYMHKMPYIDQDSQDALNYLLNGGRTPVKEVRTAPAPVASATPTIPKGAIHVQIPGQPAGYVSAEKLQAFQQAHPDAKVIQ